jgi:hypothetical protein
MNPTLSQWLLQPHGNSAHKLHFERCGNKLFSVHEKLHYRLGRPGFIESQQGRPKYETFLKSVAAVRK